MISCSIILVGLMGGIFGLACKKSASGKEAADLQAEDIETGESRHGPITLVSNGYPIVMINPYEEDAKAASTKIAELIKDYGGEVVKITSEKDEARHAIQIPNNIKYLSPIASAVPLQLLAYCLGVARKQPIDKPRALVKAITA